MEIRTGYYPYIFNEPPNRTTIATIHLLNNALYRHLGDAHGNEEGTRKEAADKKARNRDQEARQYRFVRDVHIS